MMRIGLAFDLRLDGAHAAPALDAGVEVAASVDDSDEEFDPPETIAALGAAIAALGHEVVELGDGEAALRQLLDGPRPELVFNIAEGRGGGRCREARLPAVLELLEIPYTGSDPLTLAATLDKDVAKRLVRDAGVPTPGWVCSEGLDDGELMAQLEGLKYPVIVKPVGEGSSKGIRDGSVYDDAAAVVDAVGVLRGRYDQAVLIEEFIVGDELTVGVIGNRSPDVLGIMRIVPNVAEERFVYSLDVKRDWQRRVRYEIPAQISVSDAEAVREMTLRVWRALGLRDVSRIDFRLRGGVPYFLEANPLPGLSPEYGDLVLMARGVGCDYGRLVGRILDAALERCGLAPTAR